MNEQMQLPGVDWGNREAIRVERLNRFVRESIERKERSK